MNTGTVQIMWKEIIVGFIILYLLRGVLDVYMIKKYEKLLKLFGVIEMDTLKLEAEKHGLHIEYDSRIGWSLTEPTEELIEWVIENGFEDFRLGRNEFQEMIIGTGGKSSGTASKFPKKSNSIKMICPCCGNIARVTKTTNLICGDCLQKMIEV